MSFYENSQQAILLLISLALGFLAGFIFDIYRRLRSFSTPGPILTAFGDLVFWAVMAVVTFYTLFTFNSGEVRGYLFLGFAIGLLGYVSFLSHHVIAGFVIFDIFIRKNLRRISYVFFRFKKLPVFALPRRVYTDARRIFFKIKNRK